MVPKSAFLAVTLSWVLVSLSGALPYYFSGYFNSFTDAFFESVSGFTTTGASILTDIERLPKSILFWRSLTHWIGGIGIIVLVIIIMPSLRIGNYNLFVLESSLQEKIIPRIKSEGYRLLVIYISITVAEIILLQLGGMNTFESICHAFGTVATGGFSPKNDGIAGYSPYIQYVIMIFMILAGTNFVIYYFSVLRKFRKIKLNEELRYYLGIIIIAGLVLTTILYLETPRTLEHSFREGFFQASSIITCTGFATTDYLLWPPLGLGIIFLLMFVGGSTGSTAGGIKIARHIVVLKNIKLIFKRALHPHLVGAIKINNNHISETNNNKILTFVLWYFIAFVTGSILLIFTGMDGASSIGSIATAMGGIGPGLGNVGPASNFAHIPLMAKYIISFYMILGRLEIYPVVILFTQFYWRKYSL
ncbi:MAG: TrkH family potassium uptake protein [Chlorobi bacterium]|nr:TrkH family potassium uptake protein [Chlorobiota bacterium]